MIISTIKNCEYSTSYQSYQKIINDKFPLYILVEIILINDLQYEIGELVAKLNIMTDF